MVNLLAIFLSLFVFTMTAGGVNSVLGPIGAPRYDIVAAANLLDATYLKVFAVPEVMAGPLAFLLLTLPAVFTFFIVRLLFPWR